MPFPRWWDADHLIRVEEYREDGTLVVRADLPGIDPDNDGTDRLRRSTPHGSEDGFAVLPQASSSARASRSALVSGPGLPHVSRALASRAASADATT